MTTANQHIGPGTVVQGAKGTVFTLEAQRFQGGEGRIFSVTGRDDIYIKIYSRPLDANDTAKLKALLKITDKRLPQIAAWPTDMVSHAGTAVGIVMPAVKNAKPLYQLFNPSDRRTHFPNATYRNLVAVAVNLARNVAVLHHCRIVVGDLSPANTLTNDRSAVFQIDCDSVQIKGFTCKVGLPEMLPPELQGQPLGAQMRTRDQDVFALAVILHQLLYLGRHPFAGHGALDLGAAIRGGHHALEPSKAGEFTQLTGVALDELVTPEIKSLFLQSFTSAARPSALDWAHALAALYRGLRDCKKNPLHVHPGRKCPWCRIEASGRPALFGAVYIPQPVRPAPQPVARPAPAYVQPPVPPRTATTPAFYQQAPTRRARSSAISFNAAPLKMFANKVGKAAALSTVCLVLITAYNNAQSNRSSAYDSGYRSAPARETDKERRIRERREARERKAEQARERAEQRRANQKARQDRKEADRVKAPDRSTRSWSDVTVVKPARDYDRKPSDGEPTRYSPSPQPQRPGSWSDVVTSPANRAHQPPVSQSPPSLPPHRPRPMEQFGNDLERFVHRITRLFDRQDRPRWPN